MIGTAERLLRRGTLSGCSTRWERNSSSLANEQPKAFSTPAVSTTRPEVVLKRGYVSWGNMRSCRCRNEPLWGLWSGRCVWTKASGWKASVSCWKCLKPVLGRKWLWNLKNRVPVEVGASGLCCLPSCQSHGDRVVVTHLPLCYYYYKFSEGYEHSVHSRVFVIGHGLSKIPVLVHS